MKRRAVRLATVLASLFLVTGAAHAAGSPASVDAIVRFRGTSVFTFGEGCNFVHQTFDAAYKDGRGHRGSFSLDGCSDFASSGYEYAGTYVLTLPGGGTLNGTVDGTLGATDPPTDCSSGTALAMDLTMAGAPARLDRIVGTWCSPSVPDTPGPITGVLR